MSLFRDERGQLSTARVTLFATLVVVWYLAVRGAQRTADVWNALTDITLALISWAGGARIAQYVSALRRPKVSLESSDTGITPEP